jgi:hypothetical protein
MYPRFRLFGASGRKEKGAGMAQCQSLKVCGLKFVA